VCYSVGKLAADSGLHETALAYFYQAEILDAPQGVQQAIDKAVVASLEALSQSDAATAELRRRTSMEHFEEVYP